MLTKSVGKKFHSWFKDTARISSSTSISTLATLIDQRTYQANLKRKPINSNVSDRAAPFLKQLSETGIYVIENYWDNEKCARARNEVDRVIDSYPEHVHLNAKADKRVYGANNVSELIREFSNDELFAEIANSYTDQPTRTAFTLAARMPFSPGNLGSGEGWHRDTPFRQFKAIMFLSDVSMENGPFQMVLNSHTQKSKIADSWTGKLNYPQFRITDAQVERILAKDPQRLATYTAKAGTVILADVSAIHRGMPIAAGNRYALTNYFFSIENIDKSLFEKFNVIPSVQ